MQRDRDDRTGCRAIVVYDHPRCSRGLHIHDYRWRRVIRDPWHHRHHHQLRGLLECSVRASPQSPWRLRWRVDVGAEVADP